ncbi:MAG: HAD hydrolase family protein, partial [Eubacterium sp.]|nr:HAD hydrolase family protein [Eubacterium sp.]
GDYLNDYEFMQASPNSYAMKNAHPKIKDISRYITEYTNEEYGVIRELMNHFDIIYDKYVD